VDQAGQHVDVKSVREQHFPSAAAAFDEHLKRTALVGTKSPFQNLINGYKAFVA
jgi:hypothetical protein